MASLGRVSILIYLPFTLRRVPGVKGVITQLGDRHPLHLGAELLDGGLEQIVGEGPRHLHILQFDGNRVGLERPNPDRQLARGLCVLQHNDPMLRHQTHAHTINVYSHHHQFASCGRASWRAAPFCQRYARLYHAGQGEAKGCGGVGVWGRVWETRRHGNHSSSRMLTVSPRSASPCLRVTVSPCHRVSVFPVSPRVKSPCPARRRRSSAPRRSRPR